jgi:uncharacterized protein YcgI (DUF1989 family)
MPKIKGGEGQGMRLRSGQQLQVVNTYGSQVIDLFAHNAADLGEALSIHHSRNVWYRLQPRPGDQLWTQYRRAILTLIEDTSPGVHDTLFPCCDAARYRQLGVTGYHRSCADNWREASPDWTAAAQRRAERPQPLQNVPVAADGTFKILPPVS